MRHADWKAGPSRLLLAGAALAALTASGCQKAGPSAATGPEAPPAVATLPLSDAAAGPMTYAPPVTALPQTPMRRVRVTRPRDRYAFVDRANQVGYGFGDAPPDYSFDYQGERPWSWQSDRGYQTVVEPLPGGGDRYYYYQPGSNQPFLVRDPQYAYGYQDGALAVVYDRYGRPLPADYVDRQADFASRFLYRALELYAASRREHRYAVERDNWYARRAQIAAERARWQATQDHDQEWRAYHDQYAGGDYGQHEQPQWAAERSRRELEAARIDQMNHDAQAATRERQAALEATALSQARNQASIQAEAARQSQQFDRQRFAEQAAAASRARDQALVLQAQANAAAQSKSQARLARETQAQNQALAAHDAELRARQRQPLPHSLTAAPFADARPAQPPSDMIALRQAQARAQQQAAAQLREQQSVAQAQANAHAQAVRQAQIMQAQATGLREAQLRAQQQAAAQAQNVARAQGLEREAQMRAQQATAAQAQADARSQAIRQAQMQAQATGAREAQVRAQQQAAAQAQNIARAQGAEREAQMRAQHDGIARQAEAKPHAETAAKPKPVKDAKAAADQRGRETTATPPPKREQQ